MAKYPRYIFRSELALRLIRKYVPKDSKFLEIGCADGELSSRIAKIGLTGNICDISEEAIKRAEELVRRKKLDRRLSVYKADLLTYKTASRYDLIVMLEVLEHIKDDKAALSKVNSLLEPGGYLLISVPAKKGLWGAWDDLVGHFRRYNKGELKVLLEQSEFEILTLYSYGFPFLNVIKIIRDIMAKQKLEDITEESKLKRTEKSGINPVKISFLERVPIINRHTLLPLIKFSNLFNRYDLAEGYLCLAQKIK